MTRYVCQIRRNKVLELESCSERFEENQLKEIHSIVPKRHKTKPKESNEVYSYSTSSARHFLSNIGIHIFLLVSYQEKTKRRNGVGHRGLVGLFVNKLTYSAKGRGIKSRSFPLFSWKRRPSTCQHPGQCIRQGKRNKARPANRGGKTGRRFRNGYEKGEWFGFAA